MNTSHVHPLAHCKLLRCSKLFDPEWATLMETAEPRLYKAPTRPSYCHPWSGGVTPWMSKSLAGIAPLGPGYSSVRVVPHLPHSSVGADAFVSGRVQGGAGAVEVSAWRKVHGTDNTEGTAAGTLATVTIQLTLDPSAADSVMGAVVGVPLTDAASGGVLLNMSVHVNGEQVSCMTEVESTRMLSAHSMPAFAPSTDLPSISALRVPHRFMPPLYSTSPSGAALASPLVYTITAAYSSTGTDAKDGDNGSNNKHSLASAPSSFPPAVYPASWTLDQTTMGNWVGKYGSAGYSLFGYYPNGTDLMFIPPSDAAGVSTPAAAGGDDATGGGFLKNIRAIRGCCSNPSHMFVGSGSHPSYLQDPGATSVRALGVVTSGGDGSQGVVIEVDVDEAAVANLPGAEYEVRRFHNSLLLEKDVLPANQTFDMYYTSPVCFFCSLLSIWWATAPLLSRLSA
jgi:hypothetical protein